MKKLERSLTEKIISLLASGRSAASIAREVKIHHSTISRIRSRALPNVSRNRGGRPSKLTKPTRRFINRVVLSGKADTATQVSNQLKSDCNLVVSAQTIRRALRKVGLRAVTKKKKPLLSAKHKKARLDFAKKHKHWTVVDWNKVIWSDETKINRLGSDGRKWVWKKRGAQLMDKEVRGTLKFGGGHLMMWGCMTSRGVGFACRIDGSMDAPLYVSILDDELQKTMEYFDLEWGEMIFQQDNDPKHKSKLATQWFQDNDVEVMFWPAQSPDLNPIEHLWSHLKQELATYEEAPKGIGDLWERVTEIWNRIPVSVCTKLIQSMPDRVAEVLRAKGGYTKY